MYIWVYIYIYMYIYIIPICIYIYMYMLNIYIYRPIIYTDYIKIRSITWFKKKKNGDWVAQHHITRRRPKTFCLEHVRSMLSQHSEVLLKIMRFLLGLGVPGTKKPLYTVVWSVLNTRNFGLPQHGERIREKRSDFSYETLPFQTPWWNVFEPWVTSWGHFI